MSTLAIKFDNHAVDVGFTKTSVSSNHQIISNAVTFCKPRGKRLPRRPRSPW